MNQTNPWWEKSVIYQIYPKSFQDTNNDGFGDLCGIIKHLKYFKYLGVDAIWLTPFYVSPQIDNGYDVADYKKVDPLYGTLSDFDKLIKKSHELNLKVIIDLVLNHSSTKHKWFKKSLNLDKTYKDYYIWRDAKKNQDFPNNWKSKFGGTAWCWNKKRNQYYLHLWTPEQADLNWDNYNVRKEIKNIINFWADRGVDGLRLDVINLVSKPKDLPDDILGKDGLRLYTDGPKIHEYIQEMTHEVFNPRKLMTVGEMSSATLKHCQKYSALNGKELSMVFSFDHVEVDFSKGRKWTLKSLNLIALKLIFSNWQKGMFKKAWSALFWCNHDQPRIVSRWGDENKYRIESAKLFAIILHGMQGTPYIYQGEEIGMTNPKFNSIKEYQDVETHNAYKELKLKGWDKNKILKVLNKKSRDNSRTPMQWNEKENGGFTKGIPWIKCNNNFKKINVEKTLLDKNSIFYTYKKLIYLRKKYDILTFGDYEDLLPNHSFLWCFKRQFNNKTLIVIANVSNQTQTWYTNIFKLNTYKILIRNYEKTKIMSDNIEIKPYEGIWLYK